MLVTVHAFVFMLLPLPMSAEGGDMLKKLTPILLVEEIEPSLPFWKRLGFEITAEVPHEDRTGFVILASGSTEIMMQTFSSALADVPDAVSARDPGSVVLYFEVEDVAAISEKVGDAPVVVPMRKTFYGATEIFVREPGGHVVGFAQHESRE
jgi:uncharacterized glyoxalase superfamily protein PhnB